jgi:hypothetical protein
MGDKNMEPDEINNILTKLNNLPYADQINEIEKYSINDLEELAVCLNERLIKRPRFNLLDTLLKKRCGKLNSEHSWTEKSKEKFLKINDQFIKIFEKAYHEALTAAKELEKRIQNNDPLIKDYEIEIEIQPYIHSSNDFEDVALILSEPDDYPINYHISHCYFSSEIHELPRYLDKSWNSNGEYFNGCYIGYCYAVHKLLDTGLWSFQDILYIDRIWADVHVIHQYDIENI